MRNSRSGTARSLRVFIFGIRLAHAAKHGAKWDRPKHTQDNVNQQFQQDTRALKKAGYKPSRRNVKWQANQQDHQRPSAACFVTKRHQSANGSVTRIVSSRSGDVDNNATGQPISSSTRRTYLTASPGRSAQDRAPAVEEDQPGISS